VWERTRNPWTLLQDVSRERLEKLAGNPVFREELGKLIGLRERYLSEPSWYAQHYSAGQLERVAYFSMEFGLGESLPLYAGGLGILAGDYLRRP
jgi:starch phosphorylase